LVVYADAVLSLAITLQGFKTVARQSGQVLKDVGCLETIELEPGSPLDTGDAFTRWPAAKSAVRLSR
jgi:hypothetical protein